MAIDLEPLWDFGKPEQSEQRFLAAMQGASADDRLILQTQVARTHGLRRDFARAREILAPIEAKQAAASPEVQVRYFLELGRTYASAAHSPELLTPQARATAGAHFLRAYEVAERARLDRLAIDALHMMPFVETEPDRQLAWNRKALALVERTDQPDAKAWEGPLRNNLGYALHQQGEYEAALGQFRLSRAAYERAGRARDVRIADWMIAWTLRVQKKYPEAIALQLELERAWDAAGEPDPYVFEELEQLYRAVGDEARAQYYGARLKKAPVK
ncbi:tetratricopeptide repeat protein [Ramlibacter tataouinensis]|nr:tetratricopeptide repeat protein [Ramlibacter tataouinensis]